MNKDDKTFFTGLIGTLDKKIDQKFDKIDQKIDRVQENLSTELRHQGVMIENNQKSLELLAESQSALTGRVERLETDIAEVKEYVHYIPAILDAVQDHSRRLTTLEKR